MHTLESTLVLCICYELVLYFRVVCRATFRLTDGQDVEYAYYELVH